jgi:hypothetical protein
MTDTPERSSIISGPYGGAKPEAEALFLRGKREHDEELATAGRVFLEFVRGFSILGELGKCVTVFGSARFADGHRYYELARGSGKSRRQGRRRAEHRLQHPFAARAGA